MTAVPALTVLGRYGSHPAPGGAGRGYVLSGGPKAVLVGCGSGVAGRLGYPLAGAEDLGAVVLPDLRPDHCSDLWAVGSWSAVAALSGRRRGLLLVYAYGQPEAEWRRLHRPGVLDVRRFGPADTVSVEGWRLSFLSMEHPWPGLAVRIQGPGGGCAIVGPGRLGPALAPFCAGVGLLVVEVGGPQADDEGLDGGMTPADAGRLAAAAGVRRCLLSHLDPADDPAGMLAEARSAFPDAALALEGRTYGL